MIVDGKGYQTKGFFATGNKEVFRVRTDRGYSVDATEEHPILVDFEGLKLWRKVSELNKGDALCLHNHQNLSWDGQGDFHEGYVIGYFLGDGSFRNRSATGDNDPVIYFYEDFEPFEIIKQYLSDCQVLDRADGAKTIAGRDLKRLLENYNLYSKKINNFIEEASSDFYSGFLSGLFDADATSRSQNISLYQSDLEFLQAIQRMLLRLNIPCSIHRARKAGPVIGPKGLINSKDSFVLGITNSRSIQEFNNRIGFQISRKVCLPKSKRQRDTSYTSNVISIESIGFQDVYDVTVPNVHCFDANGFKVHNCANSHLFCPVFPGDTSITMIYVDELDPEKLIPKKVLIPMLQGEAPDFMAEILGLELPNSNDRLNIPVLNTEEKKASEFANQSMLEIYCDEKLLSIAGQTIKFSDFYDKFLEWLDPQMIAYWTKIRVGKELPRKYPKGRVSADSGQFYLGNAAWEKCEPKKKLILQDGKLVVDETGQTSDTNASTAQGSNSILVEG